MSSTRELLIERTGNDGSMRGRILLKRGLAKGSQVTLSQYLGVDWVC